MDGTRLWETHLRPILIERLPGTQGSRTVQKVSMGVLMSSHHWRLWLWGLFQPSCSSALQHITSTLSSLSAGWDIDLDSFRSPTPRGKVPFTNIVATLEPSAPRQLILACHYDSKYLPPDPRAPGRVFLGASDSAVPCAMILELATSLDSQLKELKKQVCGIKLFSITAVLSCCHCISIREILVNSKQPNTDQMVTVKINKNSWGELQRSISIINNN